MEIQETQNEKGLRPQKTKIVLRFIFKKLAAEYDYKTIVYRFISGKLAAECNNIRID